MLLRRKTQGFYLKRAVTKHIMFDFDGVLAETNAIRIEGFVALFNGYPHDQVEDLIRFARSNGGLSRYEKIRYFFNKIRCEAISDEKVLSLAGQYSGLVKQKVIAAEPVKGAMEFLYDYHGLYDFAVVSGSDQEELKDVCRARQIDHFFREILGSPLHKDENIALLLRKTGWDRDRCIMVGDSRNDLAAAKLNGIEFIARDASITDWSTECNLTVIDDLTVLSLVIERGVI